MLFSGSGSLCYSAVLGRRRCPLVLCDHGRMHSPPDLRQLGLWLSAQGHTV